MQPWRTPLSIWNQSVVPCPFPTVASWHAYRFLKRQVRWSAIPISLEVGNGWKSCTTVWRVGTKFWDGDLTCPLPPSSQANKQLQPLWMDHIVVKHAQRCNQPLSSACARRLGLVCRWHPRSDLDEAGRRVFSMMEFHLWNCFLSLSDWGSEWNTGRVPSYSQLWF